MSPRKRKRGAAERKYADQTFEAIVLPFEPMSPENCRNRDYLVRASVAFLGRSSAQLHADMTTPETLDAVMKHMEQLPRLIDWMQGTAEILETARRRMLCVAEKALVDHPEWGDLTAEDAMRGLQ